MQKVCTYCHVTKPMTSFHKKKSNKDGHQHKCIECRKELNAQYHKSEEAKINHKVARKKWKLNNKDKVKQQAAIHKEKYRAHYTYIQNLRYLSTKNRTPAWLDKDDMFLIEEAYSLAKLRDKVTGIKWHVDHIIPLQGKNVSGLHVPSNLQVIPAVINLRKNNRYGE